jgi:hypothetical protein
MSQSKNNNLQSLLPDELQLLSHTQIASLWSSYGSITSLNVLQKNEGRDQQTSSLILKSIHPPAMQGTADESHLRKLLSYEVERFFYAHLASRLPADVKVARSFPLVDGQGTSGHLLMEDLRSGFPHPAWGSLSLEATQSVLRWLAGFHATYWNVHLYESAVDGKPLRLVLPPLQVPQDASPEDLEKLGNGVWEQGTYWYLDTRGEEMACVDADGDEGWLVPWAEKVSLPLAKMSIILIDLPGQRCTSYLSQVTCDAGPWRREGCKYCLLPSSFSKTRLVFTSSCLCTL